MKKITMSMSLMCLFMGTLVKAQDEVKVVETRPVPDFHAVELGFRFMPTFSSFDMKTYSGGTVKGEVTLGYGIGALLGFNFSDHIGIQGEVLYNSLSQKYKDQGLQREINVRYVNFPILLSLNTGKSNPVNLNLVLGPQFGYNIGSSIKGSSGPTSDTLITVLAIKKSDFGFAYGGGLEFALNDSHTIHFDIGFRGVYGFVNISDTNQSTTTNSVFILDRATIKTYSGYAGFTLSF